MRFAERERERESGAGVKGDESTGQGDLAVSRPWRQWRRDRQGPRAHGRELFSPVPVVAPDRDPIRVLSPFIGRRRSYFVHVHLFHGGSPRRGRGGLPGREMRPGDQRHRDTGSLSRAGRGRRALDQRDAEIRWVYIRITYSSEFVDTSFLS